jgi:asparagine synthase (glutamine-hydrolysing)
MCGIAGAIGWIDDTVIGAVRRMNACIAHRGPDGEGFWATPAPGPGVAFAHRRLAIIDLSPAGRQPMTDAVSGNVIVFNGEIYNYRDVARELRALGHVLKSSSDTEVILASYRQWGPNCLHRLRGMFTIVLYDAAKKGVFVARDRLGIKPLYWSAVSTREGQQTVLFASEVRALLATGLTSRKLSREALSTFVWNGFVVGTQTIVEGIHLLAPGHRAMVDCREVRVNPERYWSLPSPRVCNGKNIDRVRAELENAARLHLVSDVPVGVFLSGGIDSSAVAALTARANGSDSIKTYNIAFDEGEFDESKYARQVAESLKTEHVELKLRRDDFARDLPNALASLDQPTFDAINTYAVSRVATDHGLKVALAGTGGDELFGGYRSFVEIPKLQEWAQRMGPVPEPLLRRLATLMCRFKVGPSGPVPPQTRWGKLGDALATRGDLVQLYQIAYGIFTREFYSQLFEPDLEATSFGLPAGLSRELGALTDGAPALPAISTLEINNFLGERLLRDTDCASMKVALEARVPFLDHVLIEEVSKIAPEVRYQTPGSKRLLRDLALTGLDPAIFDRPKSGFVLPLEVWCRTTLRDEVNAMFSDEALCRQIGIRQEALLRLWRAFESGMPGLYWSRIWAMYILLWWCREHKVAL